MIKLIWWKCDGISSRGALIKLRWYYLSPIKYSTFSFRLCKSALSGFFCKTTLRCNRQAKRWCLFSCSKNQSIFTAYENQAKAEKAHSVDLFPDFMMVEAHFSWQRDILRVVKWKTSICTFYALSKWHIFFLSFFLSFFRIDFYHGHNFKDFSVNFHSLILCLSRGSLFVYFCY